MDMLDQISLEAKGLEQEQDAAQEAILNQGQPEPAIDPATAWAQLPKMFGGILGMAFPELAAVYTDDRCHAWGAAMSQVAEKYEWDAAEVMAKYGPEIALAVATFPLAVPTVQVIRKALAEAKKKEPLDGETLIKPGAPNEQK